VGIDTTVFKFHSTQAAAAFKAINKSATVDEVMRAGQWKLQEVFNSFYNQANQVNLANLLFQRDESTNIHSIGVFPNKT
jgi:hypothetical protein